MSLLRSFCDFSFTQPLPDAWQTEVLLELETDAVGLIEEQTGDSTVAIVVDSSLKMVSGFVSQVFMAFGVAPVCIHTHIHIHTYCLHHYIYMCVLHRRTSGSNTM